MKNQKSRHGSDVAKVMLVVFISLMLAWPAMVVGAGKEKPTWNWTKENPKPGWWDWSEKYDKNKPVRGGTLRSAASKYIGLMNPNHWPVNDWVAMTHMYEMVLYSGGDYKPTIPWLVEEWKFTGPKTATLKLRKGIQFHDGSDWNAHSYKYQLDWIMDKANGAWSRAWLAPVVKVEVVDKYTLNWTFNKPWAAFPGIIANVPGYAISAKALKADVALANADRFSRKIKGILAKIERLEKKSGSRTAKKIALQQKKLAKLEKQLAKAQAESKGAVPVDKQAVGSGAFMFEEGRPGNYLKLKRNPNWWFGQSIGRPEMPYFDGMVIQVIPDMSVRLANFRAGRLDSLGIDTSQYQLVRRDPKLNVYKRNGNHLVGFSFNHANGPTRDIRVRKAISHAIDRKALIHGTQFGLGTEASCMYPSNHWAHNPNLKPVKYDPELSKKLLAEAGYANGLKIRGYGSNDATAQPVTLAMKNMLSKVGIDWQVDALEPAAIDDRLKNLEFDLASGGWSYIFDPDMMATGQYHPNGGFNNGRTNNKEVIALIEAGRKEVDIKKRQQIYWKMEEVLYNNYEDIWLWYPMEVSAYRKSIAGYNVEMHNQGGQGYSFSHPLWFKNGRP